VSAVIYAAIVVMWAVVLVPMWLRRHDEKLESRSVDRFSTAMRTLRRSSSGAAGRRYVVMPRRTDSGVSVHVSGASAPRRGSAAGRGSIVARRRRLLLGLMGVTVLTFLLAAAGAFPWSLQLVLDVILVAFCVHLRAQARRAAAVSRQRRRATVAPAQRPAPAPAPAVPEPVAEPLAEPFVAAATGTDDAIADDTWQPIPVPRPTYTMKPAADEYVPDDVTYAPATEPAPPPRRRRAAAAKPAAEETVVPAAQPIAQPAAQPAPEPVAAGDDDSDLDAILERRWAVND
jgi:hypothetical protein